MKLDEYRLADNREFFQMGLSEAIKCIEAVVHAINDNSTEKHDLYELENQRRQDKVIEYRKTDKYKESKKQYYTKNIDKIKAYSKEKRNVYKQNEVFIAKKKEADKLYKEKHKERYKEQARARYEEKKDQVAEYNRQYNLKNADKIKQRRKELRDLNKITCEVCNGKYIKEHMKRHFNTMKHKKMLEMTSYEPLICQVIDDDNTTTENTIT
jgi:hypothetical protein